DPFLRRLRNSGPSGGARAGNRVLRARWTCHRRVSRDRWWEHLRDGRSWSSHPDTGAPGRSRRVASLLVVTAFDLDGPSTGQTGESSDRAQRGGGDRDENTCGHRDFHDRVALAVPKDQASHIALVEQ